MDGQTIVILAGIGAFIIVAVVLVVVLRRKDSLGGSVDIPGIGKGQFKAGNNPRDATVRDASGQNITADAPQGSATVEWTKARGDITATAGGTRDPKA
jgi:hypothetical protein